MVRSKVNKDCTKEKTYAASNKTEAIHVLHVDDDPSMLQVSKELLLTEGNFTIDTATSVKEAHNKLKTQTYDAIISDYDMPQKNGLQFLQELKNQKTQTPFILFTGKGREEVAIKALNLGADAYINKQGSPETVYCELADAIKKTIEHKKAKQMLADSELKYRTLVENSLQGILIMQPNPLHLVYANPAMAKILGYTTKELLSLPTKKIKELIHPNDRTIFFNRMQNPFQGKTAKTSLEFRAIKKDNSIMWLEGFSNKVEYMGQPAVQGLFLDIDQRKKAQEVLRESEEKFQSLAEESPNMIFINKQGKIVYANKKSEDVTGYTREEFYSPSFDFLSICAPEYIEEVKAAYSKHQKGEEVPPYDYALITKEGKRIDTIIATKLIDYEKEKAILGIVTDISDRKKAEDALNKTMDELVKVNQKLNVVDRLTRHDVLNKLSVITGNVFLLKRQLSNNADVAERLGEIDEACRGIAKIFEFAKMVEQIGSEELNFIDVEKTVEEATKLFSFPVPDVKVINKCHGLAVYSDSFLKQVFYNLMDNSIKHGETVTTIRIHYEVANEDTLNLIYDDDGIGISEEDKSKIFSEGFSTIGSTGYGLHLIKKVMEIYGWEIQENGEPGKGAKFTITIPKTNTNGKENFQIS